MQKSKKRKLKTTLLVIFIAVAIAVLSMLALLTYGYISTPLNKSRLLSSNIGVEIYDSSSSTASPSVYYSSDRKIVSLTNLQPHTLNAFIAIEDKRFYKHNGYDLVRIAKAGLVNLMSGNKSQGASTITQQLVKNTLLSSEKTYSRKFKEILLAIKTEKNFDKDQILNMYLNSIYFGSNAYGIESASNLYFNKSASELDINQSAILAGIIKSPSYYSPITNPDNCFKRKNIVLKQMYDNGFISLEEYEYNKSKPVEVSFQKNNYDNSYNQQVILEACELLGVSEKELLRNELKIYTYLDNNIQQAVQDANISCDFNYDKLGLVADKNGNVLAYWGDSYYNLSQMKRNPASTIKPLIVYLPAIANNLVSPITPILDEPITDGYNPCNAGNHYMGWTSVRNALSHSSNVCAVKLLNQLGLNTANEYGYKFNLFHTKQTNPSIALGDIGGGCSIIDLARAYSILQNNGVDKGLTFIYKIENKNGKIIYQNNGYQNTLFKAEDCMLVNDMLKTCAKSGTAKRLNDLPFEVASKTGTAQINGKNTDLWNIAYTTEHLLVSWCGDATSKGLDGNFSSSFYPTMINKNILQSVYSTHKPSNFVLNENIVKKAIDNIEYNTNHTVCLAPQNALDRYTIYDLFKVNNLPNNVSPTYQAPEFNLTAELTTKGAKLNMNINPLYSYQVYAISDNTTRNLGKFETEMYDDKVFKYQNVKYYAIATNKHLNTTYTSECVTLTPQSYLVEMLNNNFVNNKYRTKSKWYV